MIQRKIIIIINLINIICFAQTYYNCKEDKMINCQYSIDKNQLYIIGSEIPDYDLENDQSPWKTMKSEYNKIYLDDSIKRIGNFAFAELNNIKEIRMPHFLMNIGDYAFYSCNKLEHIHIPDYVEIIGRNCFEGCSRINNITIPQYVTIIKERTFSSCSELSTIIIGEEVHTIEDYAFSHCTSLTSINIPRNVNKIGKRPFFYCSLLTTINYSGSYLSEDEGVLFTLGSTSRTLIQYPIGNQRETYNNNR